MQFFLSLLLDADFRRCRARGHRRQPPPDRHAAARSGDRDGFALLSELLDDPSRAAEPLAMDLPEGLGLTKPSPGPHWTRGDLIAGNRLKFELFRRFGALPAAGDRHLAEFFAGFLTEESGWGGRWGVRLTTIAERESWQAARTAAELEEMLAPPRSRRLPSGELVAASIDSLLTGHARHLPLNLPNAGQCPDLPDAAVVESICTVDGDGIRGRDRGGRPAGARRAAPPRRRGPGAHGRGRGHGGPGRGARGDARGSPRRPHRLRVPRRG